MLKYFVVASISGAVSATDPGSSVYIPGSTTLTDDGECLVTVGDASMGKLNYIYTASEVEECPPGYISLDLSPLFPGGLSLSHFGGIADPRVAATRRTDGGSGHVLTCWTFGRILGEYTFQDAELSRMIENEALPQFQSTQSFWVSASAQVSVQSVLSTKCSQVIALREWLQPRLPMIISGASAAQMRALEPARVPVAAEKSLKVDESPVDPFADATAPLVDDVKSEGHVDPFAGATAPLMIGSSSLRWMVPPGAAEERFGSLKLKQGGSTLEVANAKCSYAIHESVANVEGMSGIEAVCSLTELDLILPEGLCVDVFAVDSSWPACSGCAESVDFASDHIECRRGGEMGRIMYTFPGTPLSGLYNAIHHDFTVFKSEPAPRITLLYSRKLASFEAKLEAERNRIQYIADRVCGHIIRSVKPVLLDALHPQLELLRQLVQEKLKPVRAAKAAEIARLEEVRRARDAALEAARSRDIYANILPRFRGLNVLVHAMTKGEDELTVRLNEPEVGHSRLWLHTADCGISLPFLDPPMSTSGQLALMKKLLTGFTACVDPRFSSTAWGDSGTSLAPGPDDGTTIATYIDKAHEGDSREFLNLVCRPKAGAAWTFMTYRFVKGSLNDPFPARFDEEFFYKRDPVRGDHIWMIGMAALKAESLCAGLMHIQSFVHEVVKAYPF